MKADVKQQASTVNGKKEQYLTSDIELLQMSHEKNHGDRSVPDVCAAGHILRRSIRVCHVRPPHPPRTNMSRDQLGILCLT
jgi:hypothetical protein